MWDACFSPDHASNVIGSIFAAAVGIFLIVRTLDQWQVHRARQKQKGSGFLSQKES